MTEFAAGKVDRSQLSPETNPRLTDARLAQIAAQLATLGTPTEFVFRGVDDVPSGNAKAYVYLVKFPSQTLKLTAILDTKTGKFAQYFFAEP
jgi:hypothetical protein